MAAVRQAVVRWVHNVDHWQLVEGRHTRKLVEHVTRMADAEGKVSGPATVIAGFGAGATESLLAVTPFESIKTQL